MFGGRVRVFKLDQLVADALAEKERPLETKPALDHPSSIESGRDSAIGVVEQKVVRRVESPPAFVGTRDAFDRTIRSQARDPVDAASIVRLPRELKAPDNQLLPVDGHIRRRVTRSARRARRHEQSA